MLLPERYELGNTAINQILVSLQCEGAIIELRVAWPEKILGTHSSDQTQQTLTVMNIWFVVTKVRYIL